MTSGLEEPPPGGLSITTIHRVRGVEDQREPDAVASAWEGNEARTEMAVRTTTARRAANLLEKLTASLVATRTGFGGKRARGELVVVAAATDPPAGRERRSMPAAGSSHRGKERWMDDKVAIDYVI